MSEQDVKNSEVDENQTEDVLPDWAREKLTKANNQAAKYRTEKKEAVEQAKQEAAEEYSSKIEQLEAALQDKDSEIAGGRTEVAKLKAAIAAGVANDKILPFADLLKGDDEEELASHAKELKKLFLTEEEPKKQPATDPSQGSGNDSLPLNGDPLLNSVLAAIGA